MKLIRLLVLTSLVGCTTTKESSQVEAPQAAAPKPEAEKPAEKEEENREEKRVEGKYKVGDCLMIVDLPQGETTSPYRVRVEKIEGRVYWYRWLLDDEEWAHDLSCLRNGHGPCAEFESLEKISKKVDDCPK